MFKLCSLFFTVVGCVGALLVNAANLKTKDAPFLLNEQIDVATKFNIEPQAFLKSMHASTGLDLRSTSVQVTAPTSYAVTTSCTTNPSVSVLHPLGSCMRNGASSQSEAYSAGILTTSFYSNGVCSGTAVTSTKTIGCAAGQQIPSTVVATSNSYISPAFLGAGMLQMYYPAALGVCSGSPISWVFNAPGCSPTTTNGVPSGSAYISCSGTMNTVTNYAGTTCTGTSSGSSTNPMSMACAPGNSSAGIGMGMNSCQAAVAAAPSPSSSSSSCFAGSEVVHLASGIVKSIADVIVGDSIKVYSTETKDNLFSDVIAVPHGRNSIATDFQHIVTQQGNGIKLTADHLLPSGACGTMDLPLSRSADVAVGSCIQTIDGQEMVASNTVAQGEGVYTVITEKGDYIIVNNIVASPFAVNHALANTFYAMYRWVYALAPALIGSASMNGLIAAANHVAAYFAK